MSVRVRVHDASVTLKLRSRHHPLPNPLLGAQIPDYVLPVKEKQRFKIATRRNNTHRDLYKKAARERGIKVSTD